MGILYAIKAPIDPPISKKTKTKIKPVKNRKVSKYGTLMIPCAGMGKRFSDAGFKLAKPFINVSGKPMLLQAISDLPFSDNIKLIFREEISEKKLVNSEIKSTLSKVDIQFLKSKTKGQAETCLLGLQNIDLNKSLIISACDNGLVYNHNKFDELTNDKSIDIIVWGCRNYPGARKNPEGKRF